jgi:hypothetical protein
LTLPVVLLLLHGWHLLLLLWVLLLLLLHVGHVLTRVLRILLVLLWCKRTSRPCCWWWCHQQGGWCQLSLLQWGTGSQTLLLQMLLQLLHCTCWKHHLLLLLLLLLGVCHVTPMWLLLRPLTRPNSNQQLLLLRLWRWGLLHALLLLLLLLGLLGLLLRPILLLLVGLQVLDHRPWYK